MESRPLMLENHLNAQAEVAEENSAFPDQAYTFVIVSLGVLLLGLALFPPGLDHIIHEATVEYACVGGASAQTAVADRVGQELASPQAITQALAEMHESLPPVAGETEGSQADRLSRSIEVTVESSPQTNVSTIHVRAMGTQENFQHQLLCKLLANSTAQHNVSHDLAAIGRAYTAASERVAETLELLDKAHQQRADYLARRLEEERAHHEEELASYLQRAASGDAEPDGSEIQQASLGTDSLALVEAINPEWSRMHAKLTELQTRRQSLANDDDDSVATELDSEIRELEQDLGRLAKFVSSQVASQDNPYASSTSQATADHEREANVTDIAAAIPRFDIEAAKKRIMAEQEFVSLSGQVSDATTSRNEALADLQHCQNPAGLVNETMLVVQEPRATERVRRSLTSMHFLSLLVPGAIIGIVCAWFRCEAEPPDTFISPEDVEEWLGVPVVGSISTIDGPMISAQGVSTPTLPVRIVRHSAEAVVCIAMIAVLMSVASVNGFGRLFMSDPFSAYTQSVDHLTSFFT